VSCILVSGCGASFFACTTEASFNADATWKYKSCKNQENLKAEVGQDKNGHPYGKIETTASTPEASIAAAMQSLAKLIDTIVPLLEKAVAVGSKGAVP